MWTAPPAAILAQLGPIVSHAPGKIALAYHHLDTGEQWVLNDDVYPAASLIKVHLAIAAYQQAERGALDLDARVVVPALEGDDEAEFDNLGRAPQGTPFTWRKIIDRMLTESDNAATNVLIGHLGLEALDDLRARLGLEATALRRQMLDVEARQAGRDNTLTATEMARVLAALAAGELLESAHTSELLGVLGQQRDRDKLAAGMPPGARFAHKTGELPGYRHDAGLLAGRAVVVALAEGDREADAVLAQLGGVLAAWEQARGEQFARAGAQLAEDRARRLADPRHGHDTLALAWEAGELVVRGETTLPERFALVESLSVRNEARLLTGRPGVVKVPCLMLRGGPGHAKELASQLRLGDAVTLLEEGPDWTLLRGPDGYLAWGKTNNLMPRADWHPTHVVAVPIATGETDDGLGWQLSLGSRLEAGPDGTWRLPDGRLLCLHAPESVRPLDARGTPEAVLALAKALAGLPYLWGGTSAWGIDCSGLVQLCHAVQGARLPRDADQQQAATEPVASIVELVAGDLVFFPGHVGLYMGGGEFIHASAQAGMVTINSFDPASPRFDTWLFENFTGGGRSPLRAGVATHQEV